MRTFLQGDINLAADLTWMTSLSKHFAFIGSLAKKMAATDQAKSDDKKHKVNEQGNPRRLETLGKLVPLAPGGGTR